eukprot:403339532
MNLNNNILLIDDLQEPFPHQLSIQNLESTQQIGNFASFGSKFTQNFNSISSSRSDINTEICKEQGKLMSELIEKFKQQETQFNNLSLQLPDTQHQDKINESVKLISQNINYLQYQLELFHSQDICEQINEMHTRKIQIANFQSQVQELQEKLNEIQEHNYQTQIKMKQEDMIQQINLKTQNNFNTQKTNRSFVSNYKNIDSLDDAKNRLLKVLSLTKNLNPSENLSQNTKFTSLKQTLGISSDADQSFFHQSIEELFETLESEINSLCQGYNRISEAKQDINQKMIQAIKHQQFKDNMTLKYDYEQKILQIRQEYDEKLVAQMNQIKSNQMEQSVTEEILLLNSDIDRLQNIINQNLNEIAYYKNNVDQIVNEKLDQARNSFNTEHQMKETLLMQEIENDMKLIKLEWKNKNKQLKQELTQQIKLKDQENLKLKSMLQEKETLITQDSERFSDFKVNEEDKYEKRLQLIKKMHDEQLNEMKRVTSEREQELENKLLLFTKSRDDLFQKAKEEAKKEEKLEKGPHKIDRLKDQKVQLNKKREVKIDWKGLKPIAHDADRDSLNNQTIVIQNFNRGRQNNTEISQDKSRSPIRIEDFNQSLQNDTKIQKTQNVGEQCELGDRLFEQLDFRVCLRCGLNDKIKQGSCQFHPFKCHSKSGAGKYQYSNDWHKCRENCDHTNPKSDRYCMKESSHYYGTHLPYSSNSEQNKQKFEFYQCLPSTFLKQNKDIMTDISLMFNPFKKSQMTLQNESSSESTSRRHSNQYRTSTSNTRSQKRVPEEQSFSQRRSSGQSNTSKSRTSVNNYQTRDARQQVLTNQRDRSLSNKSMHSNQTKATNFMDNKKRENHHSRHRLESSPLTTSKLEVTEQDLKYSSKIKLENKSPSSHTNFLSMTSVRQVSPFKGELDQYIKSQSSALESYTSICSSQNGGNNPFNCKVNQDSQFTLSQFNTMRNVNNEDKLDQSEMNLMMSSKYLKTEQDAKQKGNVHQNQDYKAKNNGYTNNMLSSNTSVNDILEKSQNDWVKVENYLKSKKSTQNFE